MPEEEAALAVHISSVVSTVTPEVLASRTDAYRRWMAADAQREDVPLFAAPKGVRKEEVVQP